MDAGAWVYYKITILSHFRPPKVVGTMCAQILQIYSDSFETLQVFWLWSGDVHMVLICSSDYFFHKLYLVIFWALLLSK